MKGIKVEVGGADLPDKLIKVLKGLSDDSDDDKKVIKTVPMRKEWNEIHKEIMGLCDDIVGKTKKLESLRRLLWGSIEKKLNNYSPMRINTKTNEIEILED